MVIFQSDFFLLELEENSRYFTYISNSAQTVFNLELPVFEINNQEVAVTLNNLKFVSICTLRNGVSECKVQGDIQRLDANLLVTIRCTKDSPILRFKYDLIGNQPLKLTKSKGKDNLSYLNMHSDSSSDFKELQFSNFNEQIHSFCLTESEIDKRHFENEMSFMGPLFLEKRNECTVLLAYEHGSQVPDRFVELKTSKDFSLSLNAVKGNYFDGQTISADNPFESIWLEFGACSGDEDTIARHYRNFVLNYMSLNSESRKPYIYYNTWAFQERNKWWNHKKFLDSMNEERILKEIEIAHVMGIEVFVLDTGWYEKTGDWKVNSKRFSDNLKTVKKLLDQYGMKLGLWFDPQAAAVTSNILKNNSDCTIKYRDGKESLPYPVWETEESLRMCIVSKYHADFAEELIRLFKEVGVVYFKWDAVSQYGCCDDGHFHGGKASQIEERADCYAFQIGRYMSKVVDRLCEECPEAIVDFDITEGHRYVGLGFLSSGKYFLINNGPYHRNLNIPVSKSEWDNLFVYPGAARPNICRNPLNFDKWIPSVLFLTHYLTDDPSESQIINMASMILGQNGIWGDLLSVSEEGIELIHSIISQYKKVRSDITVSYPVRTGITGGSPEIHEKINEQNGKGAVVLFSNEKCKCRYVTKNTAVQAFWCNEEIQVCFDSSGRAVIECEFKNPGAIIVFFGC